MNWYQGQVLADRYLDTMISDWKSTLLLLMQAPLLAGLAVLVWGNIEKANEQLYFVMVLSMVWIGCMNASREIVKERALFLRERMFNLEVGAYLYSKMRVLGLLDTVQVVAYSAIVYKYLDVRVPIGWLLINLLFATLCGTCLGLLISSAVRRSDRAVAIVPLVIIPQLIFSEFMIKKDSFGGVSEYIYYVMPSRWGYESLLEFAQTNPEYHVAIGKIVPLVLIGALLLGLSYPVLRAQKY
jgi:ABC-type multidrug transport system permease subunit